MKRMFCLLMAIVMFCSVNMPISAENAAVFEVPFICRDCGSRDFYVNGWINGTSWDVVVECNCGDYSVYLGSYESPPLYVCSSDGLEIYDIVADFDYGWLSGCIYGGKSYYFVFEEPIQGIITGDPVPNAEYYQLYLKTGTNYEIVRTQGELYFDLNDILSEPTFFSPGDYTFVVVACGEGYESSDYSNEVVYTVK